MSNSVFIYTLSDPDTGEVKYVGQSSDPDMRLKGHIQEGTVTPKKEWLIDVITHRGKLPVMQVIDVVSPEEASEREGEWIRELNAQGELLNKHLTTPPKEIVSLDFEAPQGANPQKWQGFMRFINEAYERGADLTSVDVAKALDVSPKTARRWMNLLVEQEPDKWSHPPADYAVNLKQKGKGRPALHVTPTTTTDD